MLKQASPAGPPFERWKMGGGRGAAEQPASNITDMMVQAHNTGHVGWSKGTHPKTRKAVFAFINFANTGSMVGHAGFFLNKILFVPASHTLGHVLALILQVVFKYFVVISANKKSTVCSITRDKEWIVIV